MFAAELEQFRYMKWNRMETESGFFHRNSLMTLLLAIFLSAGIGQWVLLDRLESSFEEIQQVSRRDELQSLLPLLRLKDDPSALAEEYLLTAARGLFQPGSGTVEAFRENVQTTFGSGTFGAFWDKDWKPLTSWGFPASDVSLFLPVLQNFYSYPGDRCFFDASEDGLAKLLENQKLAYNVFSQPFTAEVHYHSRPGIILIGLLKDPPVRMSLGVLSILATAPSQQCDLPRIKGSLVVFIPADLFHDSSRVARVLRGKTISETLPLWAGSINELASIPRTSPELLGTLQARLVRGDQGTAFAGNQGCCFIKLSQPQDWILLHIREFEPIERLARSPVLLICLLCGSLVVARFWRVRIGSAGIFSSAGHHDKWKWGAGVMDGSIGRAPQHGLFATGDHDLPRSRDGPCLDTLDAGESERSDGHRGFIRENGKAT